MGPSGEETPDGWLLPLPAPEQRTGSEDLAGTTVSGGQASPGASPAPLVASSLGTAAQPRSLELVTAAPAADLPSLCDRQAGKQFHCRHQHAGARGPDRGGSLLVLGSEWGWPCSQESWALWWLLFGKFLPCFRSRWAPGVPGSSPD